MKKLFTFLCAALMSAGMFATTVTWNSSTFSSIDLHDGQSFTKDGVTLTALDGMIDGGNFMGFSNDASFKFSTSLGNFTRIEITGNINALGGSGWTQTSPGAVWTGDANETTFGMSFDNVSQIVFTIGEPEPAKYYVVGTMNSWQVDENYEMNPNIYADTEEYFYALDLTTTSEFKVVKVEGENQTWYPTGMGNNYGQNGEITEDAEYTIYFRPNYNGGEDWFYNCIYVSKNEPEPAGEVTVVFAANSKTVERTVTLPHTFSCSYSDKDGELDAIIKELYEISAGHCSDDNYPVASGNEAVLAGSNGYDNYITISAAFEGTATVSGVYWNSDAYDGDGDWMDYTLTISIKGDEPTAVENVQTNQVPSNQVQSTKVIRNGMLLIERDGKIYNALGAEVR